MRERVKKLRAHIAQKVAGRKFQVTERDHSITQQGQKESVQAETVMVPFQELHDLTVKVLTTVNGYMVTEAELMTRVMLYGETHGEGAKTQGIVKAVSAGMEKDSNAGVMQVVHETESTALLDGAQHPGMVVMDRAMHIAISKASKHGIGMVGTFGTGGKVPSSSTGALGYYVEQAAHQGMVAFAFSGAFPLVALKGTSERLVAPNAEARAVPSARGEPPVWDMTTAVIPYFAVVKAKLENRQLPPGVAYNAAGEETSNPDDVINGGSLRTFGDAKGSGQSFTDEVLTGAMVSASTAGDRGNDNWGNLVIVINPQKAFGVDSVGEAADAFVDKVHAARNAPGETEAFVPGERGRRNASLVEQTGVVEISVTLYEQLKAKAGIQN